MCENPERAPGRWDDVPAAIKIIGFASFALSVTLVLLMHRWLTMAKCPIPQ
jgi:hypothetical protein